jgi:hypothetical protein
MGFGAGMPRDRHKKPGPFSRDQALVDLDRRTRAGRVMKGVIRELTMHVGDATAPQRLLPQTRQPPRKFNTSNRSGSRSDHCLLLIFCGTDAGMTAVSCGNPQNAVGVGGRIRR